MFHQRNANVTRCRFSWSVLYIMSLMAQMTLFAHEQEGMQLQYESYFYHMINTLSGKHVYLVCALTTNEVQQ